MPKYSVVIPCYKSSKTIGKVVALTVEEFERIGIREYEFVLVNDCSPDNGQTRAELFRLAEQFSFVKIVDLGNNSGQHNATMAGLSFATGDFIISMDDDMQTRPSEIIKLKTKMDEGYDIVYGYYEKKKESLFRRMGSLLNHITVHFLIGKPKWLKTSSFWMIRKYVRDYAIQYSLPQVHLQGVFLRITGNIACIPIQHFEREEGKSGYTLKKLVKLYSNIVGFSARPLDIVLCFGVILSIVGIIGLLIHLILQGVSAGNQSQNATLYWLYCMLTGFVITAQGVIGNYIGRICHGEMKKPQFVVRETKNIEK